MANSHSNQNNLDDLSNTKQRLIEKSRLSIDRASNVVAQIDSAKTRTKKDFFQKKLEKIQEEVIQDLSLIDLIEKTEKLEQATDGNG